MRLQRLMLNPVTGFMVEPMGYSLNAIEQGKRRFAEAFLNKHVAVRRLQFIEQINSKLQGSHTRAPVPALVYSNSEFLPSLPERFVVQVTNEPFNTHDTRVKAWLRVWGTESNLMPILIVRENVMLHHVDTFFERTIEKLTQQPEEVAA